MKFMFIFLFSFAAEASVKAESFIIKIMDRSMAVVAPEKARQMFSVIVENQSLSDQIGKFIVGDKIYKFIAVESGKSEVVEIVNQTKSLVVFVPVSPAFQEVPLEFGKKAYEIPSKE